MGTPSRQELREWARNYVALWNAGDKDAWLANWRNVAPGDFRMFDPVGTPEKRGFEECASKPCDLFQPKVSFKVADEAVEGNFPHVPVRQTVPSSIEPDQAPDPANGADDRRDPRISPVKLKMADPVGRLNDRRALA